MRILLQIDAATEVAKRAFETSPDNVYGALVSVLILVVIALCTAVVLLWKSKEKQAEKMMEVIKDATSGFKDINTTLEQIKEGEIKDKADIIEAIKNAKEHVLQHLTFIQSRFTDSNR